MFEVSLEMKLSFYFDTQINMVCFVQKQNKQQDIFSFISLAKSALKERQTLMILILTVWLDL